MNGKEETATLLTAITLVLGSLFILGWYELGLVEAAWVVGFFIGVFAGLFLVTLIAILIYKFYMHIL